ncbi:flagellar biosynthetic protein FliO [Billgrantia kenyensis]|jgi:flagellar protein FliO/FliZ|uniref:Flagellar protein n=1 Tax=Billgrantia kenyensis TaxID=321266 RepID=A0A7V9W1W8_9GAMM|nr:flagellar biosynthetic protein FliO [Halomonas kenyensis]MBA2779521.1 flagellar biosynthetic protein FliO [Halomonas kenyensis]MCG6662754.1 flagellar biosynthetic protein FliO [Halomonas kenyensis]
MSKTPSPAAETGLETLAVGGDALVGMATLGKTAAALALVIAIILLCTSLLRRWGPQKRAAGGHLQVIGSAALGSRERVVIVEVEGTWLVLGVGGGQVNKLHDLPAPARPVDAAPKPPGEGDRFATRFARALKQNAGLGGAGR